MAKLISLSSAIPVLIIIGLFVFATDPINSKSCISGDAIL